MSVTVSKEEELATFLQRCSKPEPLDLFTKQSSYSSGSNTSAASYWARQSLYEDQLRRLRLFAVEVKEANQ